MINYFLSFCTSISLSFYEPLGICMFSIPVKKRKNYILNAILSILFYLVISSILDRLQIIWFIQMIIKFIALAGIALSITESRHNDCLYMAVFSHTTHMLIFNIICAFYSSGILGSFQLDSFFWICTPFYLIGYFLTYFIFVRRLCPDNQYNVGRKQMIISILTILPFNVFNNVLFNHLENYAYSLANIGCCIFSCLCCLFVLYLQRTTALNAKLNQDYHIMQQLLNQRQLQYELSKENIDIINQKCHDLKHQINLLKKMPSSVNRDEYIKEVSDSITIYDSVFHTGNEVLDTLLTEKSLFCLKYDITIKCIAHGACLDFMDPIDLYTLMGNAIDNAIESVRNLEDQSLRMINFYVKTEMNFVSICVENYIDKKPKFVDGLPQTTKNDKNQHGFGLKSMQYTTKKYHGEMTINIENSMFVLRFLFPLNTYCAPSQQT